MGFPVRFISLYILFGSVWPEIGDIHPNHPPEHQTQPLPACGFRAALEGNNSDSYGDSLGLLNMNIIISSRTNSVLLKLSS